MKTRTSRTGKAPTPIRETPELAKLLDLAEKITGKTRSELYRECVSAELPKYVKRKAPEALRKAEDAAESLRKLLSEFDQISTGNQ